MLNVRSGLARTQIARVFLVAALAIAPSLGAQQPADSVRPFVLFVHGRAQMGRQDYEIVFEWVGAMKEGLRRAGDTALFGPRDIGFVMYQHAYEEGPTRRRDAACPGPEPIGTGVAPQDLVDAAYRNAATLPQKEREPIHAILDQVRASTNRLGAERVTELGLKGTPDTKKYLDFRSAEYCSTRNALLNGLALAKGRPVIIVAHSMGGLVSYRLFASEDSGSTPLPRVIRLITMGTQAGNSELARRLSRRIGPPYPYPRVGRWVNIRDPEDPLAWPTYTATEQLFDVDPRDSVPPVDVTVYTGIAKHHSISGYLAHPVVVRAVAAAWCAEARPRPQTCDRYTFQDVGPGTDPPGKPSWVWVTKRTARHGGAALVGAGVGATIGVFNDGGGKRDWQTVVLAAGGAALGAFLSVAVDRWWPSL